MAHNSCKAILCSYVKVPVDFHAVANVQREGVLSVMHQQLCVMPRFMHVGLAEL
jgi:hypothetical protein